jgi:spore coat protein CotH
MKIIRYIFILFVICISTNAFGQLFFSNNGNYRYFIGVSQPDSNWLKPDYDDSGWKVGYSNIGYGHKNDSTKISTTPSVYLRIKFKASDTILIKNACFYADYDDGFVAYLNGVEIARENLGKKGVKVPFDRIADRSHEPYFFRNYFEPIFGYYLDSASLSKCLKIGDNVLSVQVQNDSAKDDIFFTSFFANLTYYQYNMYDQSSHYIRQIPIDSTKFPIIVINTNKDGLPNSHVKYGAFMDIINNGPDKFNKPTDPFENYNGFKGNITIEIRGQSSVDFPKKSYNIETHDIFGENLDIPLLGMPPGNDWVLSGPFADKSQIRNELVLTLSRKFGHYQTRSRYCELILNGENLGLYMFLEKIKRDSARVNVKKMQPTDNSGVDLTGGYIVRYDKGATLFQIVYPKETDIMPHQITYITNYFKNFYALLDSGNFLNEKTGYKKYIDDQSLIDYLLINELTKNCDAYLYSTYLYKDRDDEDGRVKFGPLWDHDLAFGNTLFQDANLINGWQYEYNKTLNITKIMRDTVFVHKYAKKWFELRKSYFSDDAIMHDIDSLVANTKDARERNYNIWPIIDKTLFYPNPDYHGNTYEQEISFMKSWIVKRTAWIDNNISKIYYKPLDVNYSYLPENKFEIYPNPFKSNFTVKLNAGFQNSYSIEMYDIYGRQINLAKSGTMLPGQMVMNFDNTNIEKLSLGVYMLVIKQNGTIVGKQKIVKY